MNLFSWRVKSLSPPHFGWCLLLVSGLFLAGCGRDEVKVYRIPKEKPETPGVSANPHGANMGGHGDAIAASPKIQWKTPEGWQEVTVKGGMRAAQFSITGQSGQQAEVSAIPLPGATAGTRDIINMWREQAGLKAATESDVPSGPVEIGSAKGKLFDLVSTEALIDKKFKVRIMAALLQEEEILWIFKMTGEDELVQGQKPAFLSFLKSIRFVEKTQQASAPEMAAAVTPATAPGAAPQKPAWEVPANWKEQPPSQMLLAKYMVSGDEKAQAEITISAFPGDVGGLLANLNRWRGQIGLQPIEQADLSKQISSFDVLGGKAILVDLSGTHPRTGQKTRLLGAIVQRGDQTWFYKMMGDEQLAAREKETFVKFVQSVRYPSNAGTP